MNIIERFIINHNIPTLFEILLFLIGVGTIGGFVYLWWFVLPQYFLK